MPASRELCACGTLTASRRSPDCLIPSTKSLRNHVENVASAIGSPLPPRGFASLRVHPDVPEGIRALTAVGIRLVTLSNGASSVAQALLDRADLSERFETLLSVEDAGIWKPAAGAYAYALRRCGVDATAAMLVAVHPWDIDGAARAGLGTAWINRPDGPYPEYFTAPDIRVRSLTDLASQLA